LDACAFSDSKASVEAFESLCEEEVVAVLFDHFWCLWVELALSAGCLDGEGLFVPGFDAVTAHEEW